MYELDFGDTKKTSKKKGVHVQLIEDMKNIMKYNQLNDEQIEQLETMISWLQIGRSQVTKEIIDYIHKTVNDILNDIAIQNNLIYQSKSKYDSKIKMSAHLQNILSDDLQKKQQAHNSKSSPFSKKKMIKHIKKLIFLSQFYIYLCLRARSDPLGDCDRLLKKY